MEFGFTDFSWCDPVHGLAGRVFQTVAEATGKVRNRRDIRLADETGFRTGAGRRNRWICAQATVVFKPTWTSADDRLSTGVACRNAQPKMLAAFNPFSRRTGCFAAS